MSKFTDVTGGEWSVEFDCFLLDRVRKEADVDLANVAADGLLAVERDVTALGRVLSVACDEQWKTRGKTAHEFLKAIRGDALAKARGAVLESLADFFPANEWSAIQSTLQTRREQPDITPDQLQLAAGFLKMDAEVQKDVMSLIQQEMIPGNLPSSPDAPSASAQDATHPSPVDTSPVSVE